MTPFTPALVSVLTMLGEHVDVIAPLLEGLATGKIHKPALMALIKASMEEGSDALFEDQVRRAASPR